MIGCCWTDERGFLAAKLQIRQPPGSGRAGLHSRGGSHGGARACSHTLVSGTSATLRHDPVDVLRRALDVARLAVDAVLCVDLQPLVTRLCVHVLVHTRRAEPLLRAVEHGEVASDGYRVIAEREVWWLVVVVGGVGEGHGGEHVKGDLAIGLGVVDGRALARGLEARRVRAVMGEGEGLHAVEEVLEHTCVDEHAIEAQGRVEGWAHVAHGLELLVDPGGLHSRLIARHVHDLILGGVLGQCLERLEDLLRSHHARFHGRVRALDLGHVEETSGAADERSTRKGELGNALVPALVERSRTVGESLAALECGLDGGMGLPALELLEGAEVGVGVVKPNHIATGHERVALVVEVVEEGAPPRVFVHRPAHRVLHAAWLVLLGRDPPHLLEPDAVRLLAASLAQVELSDSLLGEGAVAALGEERGARA
mmetsp:Transcript_7227/g.19678  ORF Transcript_7227/g.19678 Transcript_7227/m.19678 type:complete len:426 (+) Transcript_7227:166-1443(+)